MEVILLQRVIKLGNMGDIVNVKAGYARYFLIPQRIANRATLENIKFFKQQKIELEKQNLIKRKKAEEIAVNMKSISISCVLPTCLRLRLRPLMHILITGSLSSNVIIFARRGSCLRFLGT